MYRIAIVDDEKAQSDELEGYAKRFSEEHKTPLEITVFNHSIDFVTDLGTGFDVVFLDIKMPDMDGMDAARRLRLVDGNVCIIFVTSMAQYVIKGYEVSALDFVVKPINYRIFEQKLGRALRLADMHGDKFLTLTYGEQYLHIRSDEVYYVEKDGNYIIFHTAKGDIRIRGTMDEWEEKMGDGFSRSLRGCLVSLAHVSRIDRNTVRVGEHELPLSRGCRRRFIEDLAAYRSGTVRR